MKVEELVGQYKVTGSNQDDSKNTYHGILHLQLDPSNRIKADWLINKEQKQEGIGFFKDNILVINFTYQGADENSYRGVVVYKCLSQNILDGFWSEDYGDPHFLGTERCFRINPLELLD
ncbi:hypothetical protein [Algibacter mikhailovii]|uniref:Uncharacterized protein n=1 Tax=Algibacter mikhailovii TaxID=425498 RepID=A0A918R2F8_9FLAO|nr:hypothetical protein [Algibacter mikhailovii]GGZ81734.1 hypothetical protein GCM10007028_19190 [Algibacter mikhailovii]